MNNLTEKNKKTLEFIIQYQNENGYSPSLTEIKNATKTKSSRGVTLQLEKLQYHKYIEREPNTRRAIRILRHPEISLNQVVDAPVLGTVKAGYGRIAEQNIEEYKQVPLSLTGGRSDVFLLKIDGDSMSLAGFKPGDLVIVTPQSNANNGDIVIAFDEESEEGTIKRFKKLNNYVLLLPESHNPLHQPKIANHFIIQGKVIGKFVE